MSSTVDQPEPAPCSPEKVEESSIVEKLQIRCRGQLAWLKEEAPECFKEQLHTRRGTSPERIYWHYGYAIALRDVLNLLGAGVNTAKN